MLLAWVGGAMNLAWMVVLTLFVAFEKLLGTRAAVLRISALALFGAGALKMMMVGALERDPLNMESRQRSSF